MHFGAGLNAFWNRFKCVYPSNIKGEYFHKLIYTRKKGIIHIMVTYLIVQNSFAIY